MAFESLYVGTGAMRAAQGAMSVIGHNIANLNTEGYTRQRANLETNPSLDKYPGEVGTGVNMAEIQRLTDEFSRMQLDTENQKLGEYTIKSSLLSEVEEVMKEPGSGGLQVALTDFFNAFHTLANSPEEYGARSIVLSKGTALADKISSISTQLKSIQTQADEFIRLKVDEINTISDRIADLNKQISSVEAAEGQNANDLRDSRDLLYRQLNKIMNVTSFEDSNKNLFVEAQGSVLVAATKSIHLSSTSNSDGYQIPVNEASGKEVIVLSGELKGIMDARDENINKVIEDLDTLASKLIEEVNRLHARGTSFVGFDSVVGNQTVEAPGVNLINSGLAILPKSGTLYITAFNETTGDYMEQGFVIDPYIDTMNDVITDINTAFGGRIVASLDGENQFSIDAASGYKFQFVNGSTGDVDSTDLLLATGVNTFFTGDSSFSIDINEYIKNDVNLISSGRSMSPGDNTNALEIAKLNQEPMLNNSSTFGGFYASMVSDIGTNTQASSRNEENQDSLVRLLEQRLTSTTGVSLEEEASSLLIYQRMFQAAAKYVQVMDEVMGTLMQI
ncbi:MAG: hypothetical protein ACD_79C00963G0004 [uncultured bacterium]|nr:MAG: hypothetical protein ACD_79C00963G0004 [uncultured bacterium]